MDWPRRASVPAVKPYSLNYPDFCCAFGDKDFFDNHIVRCMFGAVCKKQITEDDFRNRLAELWGANPNIPIHFADWGNGITSYVLAPGPWQIKIPGNWPDYPEYVQESLAQEYDRCKKHHGISCDQCSSSYGLAGASVVDQQNYRKKLPDDIAYPEAKKESHVPVGEPSGPGLFCQDIEPSDSVKDYYYIVQPTDTVYSISRMFLPGAHIRWHELRDVNYKDKFTRQDFVGPAGNIVQDCFWHDWRTGLKLRIPSNWPEPNWNIVYPGMNPPIEKITGTYLGNVSNDEAQKASKAFKWGLIGGAVALTAVTLGTIALIKRT